MVWHTLLPALLSHAEPSVLWQSPCEPGLQGHGPQVCWAMGWGSQGVRMPMMETTAGSAGCLPDIFPTVGGFGYTKVGTSQQYKLLLPLKQNLSSTSVVCRACNQHCRPQVRPCGALSCGSKANKALVHGSGRQGGSPGPLPGRVVPGPEGGE